MCERLPLVSIKWQAPQLQAAAAAAGGESDDDEEAGGQYRLRVTLQRQTGKVSSGRGGVATAGSRARVYAPRCYSVLCSSYATRTVALCLCPKRTQRAFSLSLSLSLSLLCVL